MTGTACQGGPRPAPASAAIAAAVLALALPLAPLPLAAATPPPPAAQPAAATPAASSAATPTAAPAATPSPAASAAATARLVERDLRRTALSLVAALHIAEGCRIRVTEAARHRAAEIETALLALPAAGAATRVEHAASMAAAREDAARAGRAWCSVQRADVEEMEELLVSPDGETLLRRLRALAARPSG